MHNTNLVRNIILSAGFVVLVIGAARGLSILPHALHGAGVVAPYAWQDVIMETLEASGQ